MTRRFEEDTFELPGLILCEGAADRQFLSRLMINRGFGTDIYVQYPRGAEHSGGKDKFAAYLRGISVSETFIKNVRAVLLVADNDDAPDDAFRAVQEALAAASFPVPSAPGEYAAHSSGPPTVGVLMIPPGRPGNLESICIGPLYAKWRLGAAVDSFAQQAPANNWGVSKKSKMKVQSLLAATCESKPDTSFANHWHLAEQFHLPISDAAFDEIADRLRGFADYLVA